MRTCDDNFLEVKPGFCIYLAFLVVFMPLRLVFAWLIAAAVHELFHYIPLCIFRVSVTRFTLGFRGAVMRTEAMQPWQELVSAFCGPVGGLFLLIFRRWIPLVAACALVQTIFNMLPLYPLDGGRVIRALMDMFRSGCVLHEYSKSG